MLTIWLCIESIFGIKMYFKIEIVPRIKVNELSKHGISIFSLYLNLVQGFMDIITMHFVFYILFMWVRRRFSVIWYIFTIWLYWPRPKAPTLDPWDKHFTILGVGFMNIRLTHSVYIPLLGVEKKIF